MHHNAGTTPRSRSLIIERPQIGWPVTAVAAALGIGPKTVRKRRDRFTAEREAGLQDRASYPHHSPTRLAELVTDRIAGLRRQRRTTGDRWGPSDRRGIGREIANCHDLPAAETLAGANRG